MRVCCVCVCHAASLLDRARFDGVRTDDVIEAAVACDACRNHHCDALMGKALANEPEPPSPHPYFLTDWSPPDGAHGEGPE